MTRATQTLALAVASAAVYAMLLTGIVPTSPKFQDEILPVIPWWVLVLFGAYALGTLGFDLLTINDKPEKYKELLDVCIMLRVYSRLFIVKGSCGAGILTSRIWQRVMFTMVTPYFSPNAPSCLWFLQKGSVCHATNLSKFNKPRLPFVPRASISTRRMTKSGRYTSFIHNAGRMQSCDAVML
jgi:dolichyl-phosphate mannosyltransferase polypeptide 3